MCEPDLRGRERARRLVLAAFLSHDPVWSKVVGPVIGPAVAVISFVCSIGNVPLAAALWNGGISFGGVVAFLFADLIVLPIVDIYRKYYGARVAALLFALFYVAIAGAGYIVELLFGALGLVPGNRRVQILQESVSWNYTTVLNIAALALSAVAITATPSIPAPAAGVVRQRDDIAAVLGVPTTAVRVVSGVLTETGWDSRYGGTGLRVADSISQQGKLDAALKHAIDAADSRRGFQAGKSARAELPSPTVTKRTTSATEISG